MQDWISNSHRTTVKTILRFLTAAALCVALGGCATSSMGQGKTDVTVTVANYTNDYVKLTLMSPSGQNLGIGDDAKPFSEGGTGGWSCCAMVPNVGQTVRVEFRVGGFNDTAEQYKTYNRDVVVKGTLPPPEDKLQSYLIVRIFPAHQVEVELIPSGDFDPKNPRVDKLFSGRRVMRQMGE